MPRGGGASMGKKHRGAKTTTQFTRAAKSAARKRGAGGRSASTSRGKSQKKNGR